MQENCTRHDLGAACDETRFQILKMDVEKNCHCCPHLLLGMPHPVAPTHQGSTCNHDGLWLGAVLSKCVSESLPNQTIQKLGSVEMEITMSHPFDDGNQLSNEIF